MAVDIGYVPAKCKKVTEETVVVEELFNKNWEARELRDILPPLRHSMIPFAPTMTHALTVGKSARNRRE